MNVAVGVLASAPLSKHPSVASWNRFALLALLCGLVGGLMALGNPNYRWSPARDVPYGGDFLQEWVAGDMLLSGAGSQIYDPAAFALWQHDASRTGFAWPERDFYPAVYPPPYYAIVAPLACLPYRWAVLLWLLMMLLAYLATVCLVETSLERSVSPLSGQSSLLFWSLALLFPALFMGLVMGQKGTLWLLLTAASWRLLQGGKPLAAGCVWALMAMKPTLCFLFPLVMLADRQWRFLAGLFTGLLVLCGATLMVAPLSMWNDYWQVVAGSADYQAHGGYRSGWSASLLSLLRASGCSPAIVAAVWSLAALAMVTALVRWPLGSRTAQLAHPHFQMRVLVSTALLSPHFYFYDLVWLLLPIRGWLAIERRPAVVMLSGLWFSVLAVQWLDRGWPLLSITLLILLITSTICRRQLRHLICY